jgi:hypothetical protein
VSDSDTYSGGLDRMDLSTWAGVTGGAAGPPGRPMGWCYGNERGLSIPGA